MNDKVVRESFHRLILRREHLSNKTLVIDEFALKNGGCRADIAVLNGRMIGYEIKTDSDNLARLKRQVEAYNEVFDKVYIIVGVKLIDKALCTIPDWWGIFKIDSETCDGPKFNLLRRPKQNPQKDSIGIAQLLWKNEILNLLSTCEGVKVNNRVTKQQLYELTKANITATSISKAALHFLKSREGWRKGQKALL